MTESRDIPQSARGLTRSTLSNGIPDADEEVLTDLLHWIWSWKVQLDRLVESTRAQGGVTELEQRMSCSKASYDEHQLAVVGGNLVRSIGRASERFPQISIEKRTSESLRLLRNLYEHWDEQRKSFQDTTASKVRSGKEFLELFPEGSPWSVTYAKGDCFLAGIVSLRGLTLELAQLEQIALRLEEERKQSTSLARQRI